MRPLLFALAALLLWPHAGLAENLDIALRAADAPSGEFTAGFGLGPIALAARHTEYLRYLNSALRDEDEVPADPLIRRSQVSANGRLPLEAGVLLPAGVVAALDEWDSGHRDLRLTARSGLHLPGIRFNHAATVTTRFAHDGTENRRTTGRLAVAVDSFGGAQEGVVEYEAEPIGQVTAFRFISAWRFDGRSAVRAAFSHHPVTTVSEARLGIRQVIGPFDLATDFVSNSEGAYAIRFSFALDFGPAPAPAAWSLASMLSAARATRQPPLTLGGYDIPPAEQ